MNKKYLKYVIKKNIVLFAVVTLLALIIFGSTILRMDIIHPTAESAGYYVKENANFTGSGLPYIFLPYTLVVLYMSFKSISFRYKKRAADCFYHLPFGRKSLRRFNNIFNICFILASFTLSFWLVIAAFGIKYATITLPVKDGMVYIKYYYDFTYYLVAYLLISISLVLMYLYNSFFIQMGNSFLSSLIFLIFGNLLVSGLPYAIFSIASKYSEPVYSPYTAYIFELVNGFYLPFYMYSVIDATLGGLIVGCDPVPFVSNNQLFPTILNSIVLFVVFALAIYYCFFVDDPSGEYNGIPGARNKYLSILISTPLLLAGLEQISYLYQNEFQIISLVVSLILETIVVYICYVALNKTFKIKKFEWICIGSGIAFLLIGFCLSYIPGYVPEEIRQYISIIF